MITTKAAAGAGVTGTAVHKARTALSVDFFLSGATATGLMGTVAALDLALVEVFGTHDATTFHISSRTTRDSSTIYR
ncbi:hypothetical protein [Streptomyces sp. NPDC091259]|uniref:hypothetical protein n=1 Tax=Streptomyces sp. NPDC091259 TaxID=3365976 RepID=UPI0038155CD2